VLYEETVGLSVVRDTYTFQGRRYDPESGLYYFRNRYYSPELGRFISRDPIGYAAGDVNLYRFVGNGPYGGLDPMGLRIFNFDEGTIETKEFIEWDLIQGYWALDMMIFFKPKKDKCKGCVSIRWVQKVISTNAPREGCKTPYVDPCPDPDGDGYFDTALKDYLLEEMFPTYRESFSIFSNVKTKESFRNSGIKGLHDRPGRPGLINIYWRAQTTATCVNKDGSVRGLGAIHWGFDINSSGVMTKWGPN
jgi:RHS repeat-associated protein